MENYETKISLKTLISVLKRNIKAIVGFSASFTLISAVFFLYLSPHKYKATSQVYNKTLITTTTLNTLRDAFYSDTILDDTIEYLSDYSIGKSISKAEIVNGLSIPNSNTSSYLTITYTSSERNTTTLVLKTLLDKVVDYLKVETKRSEFVGLEVSKYPETAIDISNSKQKVILTACIIFVLSYLISFYIDLQYDLVYDIDDIKSLNTNVIELNYSERKKEKHE